ncbi:MAG: tyrosine--tRNA ligase [Spiroplasma poulsonii]|uniref:Tyrosine--tRNA ligase n=1 Tax=Spiroplasma poulsonii TaxID=2138 RepID=A0A2P6FAN3_9MOLU|nr:tyrosine--tRNA ligase [Spiroplasma poulsonii]KAF0851881.1 Tyrosine--tRNA ligase [Spiroplasma poulsonii]KAF0851962.1 Tyrosine--tRNA ligase [Spiroplasma poulsonii]MBW1242466.1 tyrosine--tRNA ligase [Spiroplasma poulsonii]PQM30464.1 Tyrosine--tRNA ligase [Spiroplasma poulsonii]PWF95432.1 Tyrosine--tRNA ligase [Spiroplasma poulsonii]
MVKDIIEELKWRGLLKQVTNETKLLKAQTLKKGVYCGFDPTGDSLHVGHLIQIMLLKRFEMFGFQPIAIIGGGTGMIGDPSGKKAERVLLNDETIMYNVQAISKQMQQLIGKNVRMVNNTDWLQKMTLIDFLRTVGKDFNISYLLAKENIATRIEVGLSYTEFAYTLLQAYDFYQLYVNYDCAVQTGGSDQWGNITSGTDYIHKQIGEDNLACGLTMNLLTKADGTKFGKTESGAVWLDPKKTSPYEFYQFFFNQDDQETGKLLRYLTMLTEAEIIAIEKEHQKEPAKRIAQKKLAEAVTLFVHQADGLKTAQIVSEALFNGNLHQLSDQQLDQLQTSLPFFSLSTFDLSILDLLVQAEIVSSKREGREFLTQGAITVNGIVINEETWTVTKDKFLFNKYLIVRRGKRKYHLISCE